MTAVRITRVAAEADSEFPDSSASSGRPFTTMSGAETTPASSIRTRLDPRPPRRLFPAWRRSPPREVGRRRRQSRRLRTGLAGHCIRASTAMSRVWLSRGSAEGGKSRLGRRQSFQRTSRWCNSCIAQVQHEPSTRYIAKSTSSQNSVSETRAHVACRVFMQQVLE